MHASKVQCMTVRHISLVERQKGLTTSYLHTQLEPFASKMTICKMQDCDVKCMACEAKCMMPQKCNAVTGFVLKVSIPIQMWFSRSGTAFLAGCL